MALRGVLLLLVLLFLLSGRGAVRTLVGLLKDLLFTAQRHNGT